MVNDGLAITGQVEGFVMNFPKKAHKILDMLKADYPQRGPEYSKKYMDWHNNWARQKYVPNPAFLKSSLEPFIPAKFINKNLVGNLGDALLVDMLSTTSVRTLADNSYAVIGMGTGYTTASKTSTGVNSIVGTAMGMTATYPKQGGSWAASGDNILVYQSVFAVGSLAAVDINETELSNGADTLSYTNVSTTSVTSEDSLVMNWYLTILGA